VETQLESKLTRKAPQKQGISIAFASAVVAAVAAVSFLPGDDKHRLHTSGRYHSWGHLLAFSVVAFVVARTTHSRSARVLLFAGSLVFGLAIEYGEHKIFGNSLEWKDVLVDGLGVVCGTLLAIVTQPQQD
jgi:hypothetical protein